MTFSKTKIKLTLALILVLFIILVPFLQGFELYLPLIGWFEITSYWIRILTNIAKYSIIVVGLNLLMGYAGQVSSGHAAFFGMSAYLSGLLSKYFFTIYDPIWVIPWISILIAVMITAFVALLIGYPSLVLLKGHYLAMATLGFGIIVQVFFSKIYQLTPLVEVEAFQGIPDLNIGSINFVDTIPKYFLYWIILFFIIIIGKNIVHSRIGRALRAIHTSEITASALGVNVSYFKIQVFVVSAIFAGFIGGIYAHTDSPITAGIMSFTESVKLVTMVVIGGMASIGGALLGTSILVLLPEFFSDLKEHESIIYGLVMVLIMIFLPDGFYVGMKNIIKTKLSNKLFKKNKTKIQ